MDNMPAERLQKIMAQAGIGSRRACEEIIRQGRVEVDGEIATLGLKADLGRQRIVVDGQPLSRTEPLTYVAVHKPRGILAVTQDDRGRRTVRDLVTLPGHLYPVGRLDATSEGLILLTNDGELANRLTHPRYEHDKEYHVLVQGFPSDATLRKWRRGVYLDGRRTAPATVTRRRQEKGTTWLRIVMREGRKRQIRRVASSLGHPVLRLIRQRIGPLQLGKLQAGEWRHLSKQEIQALRRVKRGAPRRRKQTSRNT
jgi:pseudouridine synthase